MTRSECVQRYEFHYAESAWYIANQFCFSKRVNDGSEGVKSTKYCKCTVNGKGRGERGEGRGGHKV